METHYLILSATADLGNLSVSHRRILVYHLDPFITHLMVENKNKYHLLFASWVNPWQLFALQKQTNNVLCATSYALYYHWYLDHNA